MKAHPLFGSRLLPVLAFGTLALAGCGASQDDAADSADPSMSSSAQPMSPEVQELVNRGNDAQRANDYEGALSLYQEAMEIDPEHPVPQFGALMAAMATGNEALTEELTLRLQESSPDLLAMLNPDGTMGGGMPANPHGAGGMPEAPPIEEEAALPPGHPTLLPDTTGLR